MDTVRALRQVIMFKEVPEPVLKIDLLVFRSAKVAEALAAHPEAAFNSIARSPGPSHATCAGQRA